VPFIFFFFSRWKKLFFVVEEIVDVFRHLNGFPVDVSRPGTTFLSSPLNVVVVRACTSLSLSHSPPNNILG
jgi:hypothetical protein